MEIKIGNRITLKYELSFKKFKEKGKAAYLTNRNKFVGESLILLKSQINSISDIGQSNNGRTSRKLNCVEYFGVNQ